MAQASARRSFHGPLVFTFGAPKPRPQSEALAIVSPSATPGSTGRARGGARGEAATSNERERAFAGVLAALRNLTGALL
jgi:hypothetical protein